METSPEAPSPARAALAREIARFRAWASAYPPGRRHGEWECNYDSLDGLSDAVLGFAARHPFAEWSADEAREILYAIARDNEHQRIAREVRSRHPELLVPLTQIALADGEEDARWQLAVELGHVRDGDAERLLLHLARDDHEYVRRQALQALTRLGAPAAEELALTAWNRPCPEQQWARMMALWCLHRLGSAHLEPLLAEAAQDERPYLRGFAERVRRGEVDP